MSLSLFNERPLILAHRGGRSLAAENTLSAIRKAKEAGADGCEIDVQITKDGELIVLHDLNLLRSTNACAHPVFINNPPVLPWRFTLEEIKKLSADVFPRRFCPPKYKEKPWLELPAIVDPDLGVPTLDEALKLCRDLGMVVNVEIKDLSRACPENLEKSIVEKVLAAIEDVNMEDEVIISSFNHEYVFRSKQLAPNVLTGALTFHKFTGDPVEVVMKSGADAWHPGFRSLNADNVRAAREAGFAVNPYTVNAAEDVDRLIKWGVTGLVTDYPQEYALK